MSDTGANRVLRPKTPPGRGSLLLPREGEVPGRLALQPHHEETRRFGGSSQDEIWEAWT